MNAPETLRYDVLALGCAAVDDVLYVPSFPPVDGKVKVARRARQYGGLTGAALVAAARMGVRCAYAACLGTDELSGDVARNFALEGVDVSHAPVLKEAGVVHSVIAVAEDTGSRTIFYQLGGVIGAHPSLPDDEIIRQSAVLVIDHYGMAGNLRAARVARESGRAVVADFEDTEVPLFEEVLALVDHLIFSEDMAFRVTGKRDPAEAALALWKPDRSTVVVTCGIKGSWSLEQGNGLELRRHAAFAVPVKDTTGCGDVFHGAYAAALSQGRSLKERMDIASAAAALKASLADIPDQPAIEHFLSSDPPRHANDPSPTHSHS